MVAAASREETGCISYRLYEDTEVENEFVFVEEWESSEALQRHFATSHIREFMRAIPATLVAPPTSSSTQSRPRWISPRSEPADGDLQAGRDAARAPELPAHGSEEAPELPRARLRRDSSLSIKATASSRRTR